MITLDTEAIEGHARAARAEKARELRLRALAGNVESNEASVAPDAGRDASNPNAQLGRPLHSNEVQRRLKLCNSGLAFERSNAFPDKTGIYLWNHVRTAAGAFERKRVFICGMESGMMPEFSVLHSTEIKTPDPDAIGGKDMGRDLDWKRTRTFADETRGWRTVLARLLHARIISEADVRTHFGWAPTMESQRWFDQTR